MGEFEVTGPDRNAFVNRITCNDVGALEAGQAHYTALLNEEGCFIDDCLVYRFDDRLMLVVNASNLTKDWDHVVDRKGGANVRLRNLSDEVALLAVQGPLAEALVGRFTTFPVADLRYYHHGEATVKGVQCFVSRTGYTGEDGFELYCRARDVEPLWAALVGEGGGTPCGLGARDTLRLEAGLPLYGNDLDDTINPYEARLGWIVKLDKGSSFVGWEALRALKARGATRKLVGFELLEKAFPRHGYEVFAQGRKVDVVRSGTVSPTLGTPIGLTYLPTHLAQPGSEFEVDCRGRRVAARVVKLPFVPHRVKRRN
jgi:aminomethyltransferase